MPSTGKRRDMQKIQHASNEEHENPGIGFPKAPWAVDIGMFNVLFHLENPQKVNLFLGQDFRSVLIFRVTHEISKYPNGQLRL